MTAARTAHDVGATAGGGGAVAAHPVRRPHRGRLTGVAAGRPAAGGFAPGEAAATRPFTIRPVANRSAATEPVTTEPAATRPAATESAASRSVVSRPAALPVPSAAPSPPDRGPHGREPRPAPPAARRWRPSAPACRQRVRRLRAGSRGGPRSSDDDRGRHGAPPGHHPGPAVRARAGCGRGLRFHRWGRHPLPPTAADPAGRRAGCRAPAGALLAPVPSLLAHRSPRKSFRRGITTGAIKG